MNYGTTVLIVKPEVQLKRDLPTTTANVSVRPAASTA
jgi:hypothetical protein